MLRNQIKAIYLQSMTGFVDRVDKICCELHGLHGSQYAHEDEEVEYIRKNLSVHLANSLVNDTEHSVVEVVMSLQRSLLPPRVMLLKSILRVQRDAIAALSSLAATMSIDTFEEETTTNAPYIKLLARECPEQLNCELSRYDVHLRDLGMAFSGESVLPDTGIVWKWVNNYRDHIQEAAASSLNTMRRVLSYTYEDEDAFSGVKILSPESDRVSAALRKQDACRILHQPDHLEGDNRSVAVLVDGPAGVACRASRIFSVVLGAALEGRMPKDTINGNALSSIIFRASITRGPPSSSNQHTQHGASVDAHSTPVSPTGSSVSRACSSIVSYGGGHLVRKGLTVPVELDLLDSVFHGLYKLVSKQTGALSIDLNTIRTHALDHARDHNNALFLALRRPDMQKSIHLQTGSLLRRMCELVNEEGCSYGSRKHGDAPLLQCSNDRAREALRLAIEAFQTAMRANPSQFLKTWTNNNRNRMMQMRRISNKRLRDASVGDSGSQYQYRI
jgi:hypothetical protein